MSRRHITDAVRLDNDSLQGYVDNADKQAPLIVCCTITQFQPTPRGHLASLVLISGVQPWDGGFELWAPKLFPDRVVSH